MKTLKESILSRSSHSAEAAKNIILIEEWLKRYNIKNYTIKDNFEIDVDGYVDLYKKDIIEFPEYIQFGVVNGIFDCSYCHLKSLRGAPRITKGSFDCSNNELVSLEGIPEKVEKSIICYSNKLTSLKGAPKKVESFLCYDNKLTSLKGCPVEVDGDFDCRFNNLTSLEGAPKKVEGYFDCSYNKTKFTKEDVMKVCNINSNCIIV